MGASSRLAPAAYDYATIGAVPRFHFVRHGRTTWNVEGRVQGGGNLDRLGVAQACALAARLADRAFDAVYASPYPRTRQTACRSPRTGADGAEAEGFLPSVMRRRLR